MTLDAAAAADDCLCKHGIVGAQGSCDGDVHVRPALLADRPHLWSQSVDSARRSHRSLGQLVALVVSLVAIPVAGVLAAMVYGGMTTQYAQEAHERHTVMATVTDAGSDGGGYDCRASEVAGRGWRAHWPASTRHAAKVGDRIEIWVDKDGNPVAPPTPTWHALGDAVAAALATLLLVGVWMTFLVTGRAFAA